MIGAKTTISDLSEISAAAQLCNLHYDNTRTSVLRVHNWSFARRQATLALYAAAAGTPENAAGTTPLPMVPWLYEYAYPVDCLRVRSVYQPNSQAAPIPFIISSDVDSGGNDIKVILTNQPQAILIYTKDIANPDLWDNEFADAMVASLASDLAIPLTGDKAIADGCFKAANATVLQARTTDSTETPSNRENIPDWVAVRGYATSSSADSGFINSVLG
ncbi:hypothetical protein CU669_15090 [Paramagnetospirillum kuznetsovii]|uniref:Uncharacterized protein n=2 Tax=Paramagnetospirillum kuznetsovii TaxID=2053833 RepID=A0A364NVG3_9PROT|nr:hypothetical protein CU669_15090 [Paramagnetospirillum kuznetsovii]